MIGTLQASEVDHDVLAAKSDNSWRFFKCAVAFVALLSLSSCSDDQIVNNDDDSGTDILSRLHEMDGITVTELQSPHPQKRLFQIDMEQPMDHNDPNGPTLTQRLYLHHVDEARPMLFAPNGYDTRADYELGGELMAMLEANFISSSHRYWPGSAPDNLYDLQFLTIAQAAADHHAIVTKFREIYQGVWLSAGVSKSGMTVIYHRRFYPDDVDATVAIAAPFKFSTSDERYPEFLLTIGTPQARQRVYDFQRLALERRGTLVPLFEAWFPENGYVLYHDPDESFESAVTEILPEFWEQRLISDVDQLPGNESTDQEILECLRGLENFVRYSEHGLVHGIPFFYQAYTETGLESSTTTHLDDLLVTDRIDVLGFFADRGVYPVYDSTTTYDIYNWVINSGNNMIFLYGENDPWTAGAVELTGATNAIKVVNPGDNHSVFINELPDADRDRVIAALEQWLQLEIR